MAGEVDQHAVVVVGGGGQPLFELVAEVGQRGPGSHQLVDILGVEVAAFRADENRVHGFGVALGELQLILGWQVFVSGNPHHQRVGARNGDGRGRRGRGLDLGRAALVLQVALCFCGGGGCAGSIPAASVKIANVRKRMAVTCGPLGTRKSPDRRWAPETPPRRNPVRG